MKAFKSIVLFLAIPFGVPFSTFAITNPCLKTLEDYVKLRDNADSQAYKMLFTEKATFNIPGLKISIEGAEQIAQRQASAVDQFKTQHMLTDVNISVGNKPERLNAESRFILIQQAKNSQSNEKSIFSGKYIDELLLVKGKCFIDKRTVEIINSNTWF